MSATTETTPASGGATAASTGIVSRAKVGWRDLTWVTLRQHRGVLIATAVLFLIGAAMMAVLIGIIGEQDPIKVRIPFVGSAYGLAMLSAVGLTCLGALVATFWAAPLLAREYELRTHLFAWSQDVPAQRLVWAKVAVLCAVAALLAAVTGGTAAALLAHMDRTQGAMDEPTFGMSPVVQIGYTLFGFALGLAASAITRRTVAAMGVAITGFIVVRFVVSVFFRPYYQTPVRRILPIDSQDTTYPTSYGLYVDSGYLDRAGNPVAYDTGPLLRCSGPTEQAYTACLRRNGVVSDYTAYQPIERLGAFQWIEAGIFAGLAAVLFLVTWRVLRRVTRL